MPFIPSSFQTVIRPHARIIVTTHVNPDGDAIGSEIALAGFLRKLGKHVSILNHSATPDNLVWLDPMREVRQFSAAGDAQAILDAQAIIVVDANHPERVRSLESHLLQSPAQKIVIDHHLDAHPFADHYFVDTDATSTGEILYRIIHEAGDAYFDLAIARALYAAIMTDTGSFRHPRTDGEIHRMAAHLLDLGVDPTDVHARIYEVWTPGRMRLLGEVLDSMKLAYDGKLAYITCTQRMFRDTGTTEVDTDNFTVYPMSVRGVVAGVLFNELGDGGVKISLRSKGRVAVNELAKEFQGGGHINAAGARLFDISVDDAIKAVVEQAGKYLTDGTAPGTVLPAAAPDATSSFNPLE